MRLVILQGFTFNVMLKRKQGIEESYINWVFLRIGYSNAPSETAGGSISVFLNLCTSLTLHFPSSQVTLKSLT